MKNTFTKRFLDVLMLRRAENHLHPDDLQARQRLNLFRTYSLASFIITIALTSQVVSVLRQFDNITLTLFLLGPFILINYFLLNRTLNFRVAYYTGILISLVALHFLTLYAGGIRNAGLFYMGGLILLTFMLLGNRDGKIISLLCIADLIFFYVYSVTLGENVRNIVDTDGTGEMLNLDYLISYSTGLFLIYSLSNNLESSKNIVIARVTESKIALEKKNEELKKLSLVASSTDNAVIITDSKGVIEWVNQGFTRLMGYEPSEVVGVQSLNLYGSPSTSEDTLQQLKEKMRAGQSFSGELKKTLNDGRIVWQQLMVTPVFEENGELTRFVHVGSDITERKLAEERMAEYYHYLEKANKELDKFAYVVSHDLKAPLRAITNLTAWIEEDIGDKFTDDTRGHFKMLKGRVMRMEALINGILDYSRADRVKSPNVKVDLKELMGEILEMLVEEDKTEVNILNRLPVLTAERMKLQQVFSNLISNAIKHNDKEKTIINLSCEESEEDYTFTVEDNGPGIEPQFFDRIFVIFQTLQARDTFESTGVGLAIVKKIIDEAGGSIWVESELGKGTRFIFRWPKVSKVALKPLQMSITHKARPEEINTTPIQKLATAS